MQRICAALNVVILGVVVVVGVPNRLQLQSVLVGMKARQNEDGEKLNFLQFCTHRDPPASIHFFSAGFKVVILVPDVVVEVVTVVVVVVVVSVASVAFKQKFDPCWS